MFSEYILPSVMSWPKVSLLTVSIPSKLKIKSTIYVPFSSDSDNFANKKKCKLLLKKIKNVGSKKKKKESKFFIDFHADFFLIILD